MSPAAISFLCTALLGPVVAFANELGVGAGVGTIRKPYAGSDDEVIGLPVLLYENRWIGVAGPTLDLKINEARSLSFRLRGRYEPGVGYESDDAPVLTGMAERKAGVWIGGALHWHPGFADFGFEWLTDASDYSGGQRAMLSAEKRFRVGNRFFIAPRLEAIYLNGDYVNYYFGVAPHESLATRPAYAADSALNTRLGVRFDYRAGNRHSVFLDFAATRLDSSIKDSPIVDRSATSSALLGYVYLFRVR